jgi:hypothetical protein
LCMKRTVLEHKSEEPDRKWLRSDTSEMLNSSILKQIKFLYVNYLRIFNEVDTYVIVSRTLAREWKVAVAFRALERCGVYKFIF